MKLVKFLFFLAFPLIATGCMTMQTPSYVPALDNYEQLQSGHYKKTAIGDFTVADSNLQQISVRGNPLKSSVNDSFGNYLKAALEEEIYKAGLLSKDSKCVISGMIIENDIDAAVSTASGHISANVVITDNGTIVFNKTVKGAHQWPSSFIGAVAIPRARENYPLIVRNFIRTLIEDEDFKKAMAE